MPTMTNAASTALKLNWSCNQAVIVHSMLVYRDRRRRRYATELGNLLRPHRPHAVPVAHPAQARNTIIQLAVALAPVGRRDPPLERLYATLHVHERPVALGE